VARPFSGESIWRVRVRTSCIAARVGRDIGAGQLFDAEVHQLQGWSTDVAGLCSDGALQQLRGLPMRLAAPRRASRAAQGWGGGLRAVAVFDVVRVASMHVRLHGQTGHIQPSASMPLRELGGEVCLLAAHVMLPLLSARPPLLHAARRAFGLFGSGAPVVT
jgi:hypothetical protein